MIDTSHEYVIMCEKATELQEAFAALPKSQKDFWLQNESKQFLLFRQDQLQKFLLDTHDEDGKQARTNEDLKGMLESLSDTIKQNGWLFTFDQAWLCLTMKLLYSTKWNVITKIWEAI